MKVYAYDAAPNPQRLALFLKLKGVEIETQQVDLGNGEQHTDEYRHINPSGTVPALVLDDGSILTQSLAICEYLEEIYPQPALLPADASGRARVRALAQLVACDIHPLNNLRVLRYLSDTLEVAEDAKLDWYRHWISAGFSALEALLRLVPDFSSEPLRLFLPPAIFERYVEGLRKAGWQG